MSSQFGKRCIATDEGVCRVASLVHFCCKDQQTGVFMVAMGIMWCTMARGS